jgi:hypothetical protein
MRGSPFARLGIIALACFGAAVGCKYDPHPQDGTLRCSTAGECPEGYTCQTNTNLCFSKSGMSRDGGLGGDAIPPAVLNRYIGDWALGPTSTVDTRCDNGFVETTLLNPLSDQSPMTISAGTPGLADLDSSWLCQLYLRLDTSGAHLFDGNPSCIDDSTDPTNTWTATQFDVVTNNGITATHSAFYNRVDRYADGTVVNCMQTVHAPLSKQ